MNQDQIIGRVAALESIFCQLLTLQLSNNADKDKLLALLRDGISTQKGSLEGDAKASYLEAFNRIFEIAHATALHLEKR